MADPAPPGRTQDRAALRHPARPGRAGRLPLGARADRGLRPAAAAMKDTAVVIGAGILGCSTAWHLAARGLAVTVVDRERSPGAGSTSKSTAIVRQRYTLPAGMALALEGLRTWERWPELVPAAPDGRRARLVRSGVLFVLPAEAPGTDALATTMASLGIAVERLDPAAMARRFPAMRFDSDEPVTGLHEP